MRKHFKLNLVLVVAVLVLKIKPFDVSETNAEIPYRRCVITQNWVVLLIG